MDTAEKRKFSPAQKMLIASVFLITAAIIQHFVFDLVGVGADARQELRMTNTEIEVFYGFDMHASFYSPGARHFYFAARDGVQSISSTGEIRWHQGFNMSLPVMVGRGDIVAVGEPGGHRIYVFNSSELLYVANLPHPVLYFTVNGSGYLSVITQLDTGREIRVFHYDRPDEYIYRAPINDANVFPVSVDVSECGTYIVKALWDVDTLIFSRLTFSYVRLVDSRGIPNGLFATYDFPDEFIIRTRFTSCGMVIVITDQQILGYPAGEGTQGPAWNIPLYNRPDKIYIGANSFAYVTGDPFLNQPEAISHGVLHIYNFDGNKLGSHNLGRRATHLTINHNTVLVGMGRTFYAINQHGIRLWDYQAIHDVQDMIFLENTDTVLLAGGIRAAVMRRLRVS